MYRSASTNCATACPSKISVLKITRVAQKTGRLKECKEIAVAYLKINRGLGRMKDHKAHRGVLPSSLAQIRSDDLSAVTFTNLATQSNQKKEGSALNRAYQPAIYECKILILKERCVKTKLAKNSVPFWDITQRILVIP